MKSIKKLAAPYLAALTLITGGLATTSAIADESATPEPTATTQETASAVTPLATYPGCTLGWACVWQYNDYGGGWAAAPSNGPFKKWSVDGARTGHNSAGANGNASKYSRYWNSEGTKYFDLRSASWSGTAATRDPNLANGAGFNGQSNEAWKNRIRTVTFHGGTNCK